MLLLFFMTESLTSDWELESVGIVIIIYYFNFSFCIKFSCAKVSRDNSVLMDLLLFLDKLNSCTSLYFYCYYHLFIYLFVFACLCYWMNESFLMDFVRFLTCFRRECLESGNNHYFIKQFTAKRTKAADCYGADS